MTTTDLRALDRAMLSSIAWTGAAKWTVQALSWISTIFVVRLLSPTDYGIVGMAATFLAILAPLCDFGIWTAIVQGTAVTRDQIERLNGFSLALGVACTGIAWAGSIPITAFYQDPTLRSVLPVMGLTFLFGSFKVVPTALIARDMGFRTLAALEALEALSLLVITLSLALGGFGYWALAIGPVASRAVGALLAIRARPTAFRIPYPFSRISGLVHFGALVAVSTLAWYAYSHADQVVVGRMMGEATLGAYTIGITLASLPIDKIAQLYQRVAASVIARVQDDRAAVARYLLGLTEGVSILSFPLTIGMALVADLFVPVVLGDQWQAAIVPLRLLAVAAALRSLDPLLAQVLFATGHASQNARSMTVAALSFPVLFFLSARWGLAGIATTWLIAHPAIVMTWQLRYTLRVAESRLIDYLKVLWPAVSSTAIMAAAVIGVRILLGDRASPPVAFAACIAMGVAAYLTAIATLHPHRLQVAWRFARQRTAEPLAEQPLA
jgi:PST family polysaccharide transporter